MELLADWFAASKTYSGKWPRDGKWDWVERSFKRYAEEMHPINGYFLTGFLCLFGFEKCVMISMYGDDKVSFDWKGAYEKIERQDKDMAVRFKTLWNHYNSCSKKLK